MAKGIKEENVLKTAETTSEGLYKNEIQVRSTI